MTEPITDQQHIALTRSDLAVILAHHADVLAAQLRSDAGRDAWIAAERLTEHANELTTEEKPSAVTELLDNIWTFNLEQQPATTEDLASADNPTPLRWGLNDVLRSDDDSVIVMLSGPDREAYWLELDPERAAVLREDLAGPPAVETHIVADGSNDPEHIDDCPGCDTTAR